jgi:hypothetical protein
VKQARGLLRILLVVALGYVPAVNAALLFENFIPLVPSGPGSLTGTWGAEFTVGPQSLSVTKLGTFAVASTDMSVGIWRVSDQTLIGSVDVPVAGIGIQGWNFTNVTPFTLVANEKYRIGAETETNTIGWGNSYTLGSGIASLTSGYFTAPGFNYPSAPGLGRFFAANAEIAPIPEPSSYALLIAGLAWLLFVYRRRQNEVGVTIR